MVSSVNVWNWCCCPLPKALLENLQNSLKTINYSSQVVTKSCRFGTTGESGGWWLRPTPTPRRVTEAALELSKTPAKDQTHVHFTLLIGLSLDWIMLIDAQSCAAIRDTCYKIVWWETDGKGNYRVVYPNNWYRLLIQQPFKQPKSSNRFPELWK